jgi:hypothetical protein
MAEAVSMMPGLSRVQRLIQDSGEGIKIASAALCGKLLQ